MSYPFFSSQFFFLFHKWGILGYSIIISINNDIFTTIFMIFYHEDDKKSPGPNDQFLHLRPKPTKAEANKAQRNRPQSFGEPPNICVNCRMFFLIYYVLFQMHQSNEHQVVLKKVKIGSSGRYKCEVGEMSPKSGRENVFLTTLVALHFTPVSK